MDEVRVGQPDAESWVVLSDPYQGGYDLVDFKIAVHGPSLEASSWVRTMEGPAGLASFVRSLADDWRGWSGVRQWEAIEHQLAVEAACDRLGHVALRITVRESWKPESAALRVSAVEVALRHHDGVDRHDLFVSLAQPFGREEPRFAEIYRVPVAFNGGRRAAVIATVVMVFAVALVTRTFALANRLVVLPILGLVFAGVMMRRRLRGRPNLVLLAVGDHDLVALRVTFLTGTWKVLDRIGRWPFASVRADRGGDSFALHLAIPGEQSLNLKPLAISQDAAAILRRLVPDETPLSGDGPGNAP